MNILAIDTSTSAASIALATGEQIIAESLLNTNRTLSARLVPEIERLLATVDLKCADIDLFACSVGPGSFTGVRGGVATIQGLALAVDKPCAGFSSLAMLAMNVPLATMPVCPMLDARKSEVYAALYDCSSTLPTPRIPDCVIPPADLLNQLESTTDESIIFLGEGILRYHDLIVEHLGTRALFPPFPLHTPRSANGVLLALQCHRTDALLTPGQLLPRYLRASDAELTKSRGCPR